MPEHYRYSMHPRPFHEITLENICGLKPVSYWVPRREEIQRIVEIAKAVSTGMPKILDVGCGTGFVAYLLALTNEVKVAGFDPDSSLLKDSPYRHPNLRLAVGDSLDALHLLSGKVDVVINSWMPTELNLTPDIRNIKAQAIVYVKDAGGGTGIPASDYSPYIIEGDCDRQARKKNPVPKSDFVSYEPGENYRSAFMWRGPTVREIRLHVLGMDDEGIKEHDYNIVEVQLQKNMAIPKLPAIAAPEKYRWEASLEKLKGEADRIRLC
jgi:SAM-dependent methyltransferase